MASTTFVYTSSIRRRLSLVQVARLLTLLTFCLVLFRTAWMCDDAFITLRVVDNFANGYGLVWNTDERVQAYTHPLWLLLLLPLYAITREPYYSVLALSIVCSVGAVALIVRTFNKIGTILLAGILLTGSVAFVDFSTSGLENPLSHFLLVAFGLAYLHAHQQASDNNRLMAGLAGLTILNRMDLALFVLPAIAERFLSAKSWRSRFELALLTFAPIVAWMAFSTFYYGFPLPNTFYAKQTASVARIEYVERGVAYILNSLVHDPMTFAAIVAGILLSVIATRHNPVRFLGLGALAYLAYVVWIGGDFMRGRFLAPVFVVCVVLILVSLESARLPRIVLPSLAGIAVGLALLSYPTPTWLSSYPYPPTSALFLTESHPVLSIARRLGSILPGFHINDERSGYYWKTGLLPHFTVGARIEDFWPAQTGLRLKETQTRVMVHGMIGFTGFYAGPNVKIIDRFALADAFLARLPRQGSGRWSIGHIHRLPPDGYVRSRLYDQNLLSDDKLRLLYEDIRLVTQGDLFSWERATAIVRLNLYPPKIIPQDVQHLTRDFTHNQVAAHLQALPPEGLFVYTTPYSRTTPQAVLFLADTQTSYRLTFANDWGGPAVTTIEVPPPDRQESRGLAARLVELPPETSGYFNFLRVESPNATSTSRLGYLRYIASGPPSSEESRLLGAGITLSTSIGLHPAFSPPTVVGLSTMAGTWYSAVETNELRLQLRPASCDTEETSWEAKLAINGQIVQEFAWDSASCSQRITFTYPIQPPLMQRGWNRIEIYTSRPDSIAIYELRLSVPNSTS